MNNYLLLAGAILQLVAGLVFYKVGKNALRKIRRGSFPHPGKIWKIASIFILLLSFGMIVEASVYLIKSVLSLLM